MKYKCFLCGIPKARKTCKNFAGSFGAKPHGFTSSMPKVQRSGRLKNFAPK
jgi:hypothetical protein